MMEQALTTDYKTPSDNNRAWTNATFECTRGKQQQQQTTTTVDFTFTANASAGRFKGMPATRRHWLQLRPTPITSTDIHITSKFACNGKELTPLPKGGTPEAGFWWTCGHTGNALRPSMACTDGALVLACPPSSNSAATVVTAQFQ
jgi:hypothetical protein